MDQWIKISSRCSDCDASSEANKRQNEADEETRAGAEAEDRYEERKEVVNGSRTPDKKTEEEHEKGSIRAEGSGSEFEVAGFHQTYARDKEQVDLDGLILLPCTPNVLKTHQENKIEAHSNKKHPISVYARKKCRKKQPLENGVQRNLSGSLEIGKVPSQQELNSKDHNHENIQQQDSCHDDMGQVMEQDEMQDINNNSKEAEILWQLAKELGVTGWNDNVKQVQQMVELEERDIKESEKLGGMRKTP